MVYVGWEKAFEIGIPFIDADHRLLVKLINQANDAINSRAETAILSSILSALYDYTNFHFLREEKMMELAGFQGLVGHREEHHSLVGQVQDLNRKFRDNPESLDAQKLRDFLKNWLVDHISGEDFEYRQVCLDDNNAQKEAGAMLFMEEERHHTPIADLSSLSIMIVDDNEQILLLIKTILKALGISRVQVEASANKAIDKLIKRPVDLIFCDWVMDEMNGADFTREVKNLDLSSKVVILTGLSIDSIQERASTELIDGYLEKPITAKSLLGAISAVMAD